MGILDLLRASSSGTKQYLRDMGRKFGLEVRLTGINSRDDLRLVHFLESRLIDTVIDVGANNGGFARMLLEAGFPGRVISFEPIPAAHRDLRIAAAKFSGSWLVAPQMALADSQGVEKFNVTEGNASSSLLEPTQEFIEDTPHVKVDKIVEVATHRLDMLVDDYSIDPARTLLKLDVQGGEKRVLSGAAGILPGLAGVLSEMSLMQLYHDQPDFFELHAFLVEQGFELWDIWPGYRSAKSRRLMQFDGLYFRKTAN